VQESATKLVQCIGHLRYDERLEYLVLIRTEKELEEM